MKRLLVCLLVCLGVLTPRARATGPDQLFESLRRKILAVTDYTAQVKIKINVTYMRIPPMAGTLYFKAPDKMRLERRGGLSILPRRNVHLTLNNLVPTGNVTVIDAGTEMKNGRNLRIIKVIPEDDKSEIILAKIWVDEAHMLAMHLETTTRNEGTVNMEMEYGKYVNYSLPDKVTIIMDIKDFKLPKGVALDYNESTDPKPDKEIKNKKGTVQISYLSYEINKGLSDAVFNEE